MRKVILTLRQRPKLNLGERRVVSTFIKVRSRGTTTTVTAIDTSNRLHYSLCMKVFTWAVKYTVKLSWKGCSASNEHVHIAFTKECRSRFQWQCSFSVHMRINFVTVVLIPWKYTLKHFQMFYVFLSSHPTEGWRRRCLSYICVRLAGQSERFKIYLS